MSIDLPHPYLHTLWCEDIRSEVGNKVSLMGVYGPQIIMPTLPALMPKLVSYSNLVFPKEPQPRHLQVKLLMDDAVLSEQSVDLSTVPGLNAAVNGHDATRGMMNLVTILSPLELPADAQCLQVVADLDGITIHGNKLWIAIAAGPASPPEEAPPPSQ